MLNAQIQNGSILGTCLFFPAALVPCTGGAGERIGLNVGRLLCFETNAHSVTGRN